MPKQAFEQLVSEHGPRVLNLAIRILGNSEAAQDVHQEVFLAVWRNWTGLAGKVSNWSGYLYRATARKAIDMVRQNRRNAALDLPPDPAGPSGYQPDSNLRLNELQQKITACLSDLPERQMEIFVLSRMEGLTYEEIARALDCSPATVRVHLYRALKELAGRLETFLIQR